MWQLLRICSLATIVYETKSMRRYYKNNLKSHDENDQTKRQQSDLMERNYLILTRISIY